MFFFVCVWGGRIYDAKVYSSLLAWKGGILNWIAINVDK